MLTFSMQLDKATRSWVLTVIEQQNRIVAMLKDIPGLKTEAALCFADAYPFAVNEAAAETGIPAGRFPDTNPWPTLDDALGYRPPQAPLHPSRPRRR